MAHTKMPLPSVKTAELRMRDTTDVSRVCKRGAFADRNQYFGDSHKESVSLPAEKTVASKAALKSAQYDDN